MVQWVYGLMVQSQRFFKVWGNQHLAALRRCEKQKTQEMLIG